MSRRSPFLLIALTACLSPLACTSQAGTPPPGRTAGAGGKPDFDAAPAPAPVVAAPAAAPAPQVAAAAPSGGGAPSCEAARFELGPDTVIARLGEQELKSSDLGPELAKAEAAALRTYCDQVSNMRKQALDDAIDDRLLTAAATKAGFTGGGDAWLQGEVAKQVEQPTDDAIQGFYDANKDPNTPPLDKVRDQVVAAMMERPTQNAIRGLLEDLRKNVAVQTMLPDVAAPPLELRDEATTAAFGPADAKIHIVEFSDFECPYCATAAEAVSALKERYGDKVRFSYRHFPLSFHPNARPAAEMAQCAAAQDKFWGFHDAVFAASRELGPDALRGAAEKAGMDLDALDACMKSGDAARQVEADMKLASESGVNGTPNFFFNGRAFEGSATQLGAAIEAELARAG